MEKGDNFFTFVSPGNAVDRTFNIYLSHWPLFTQLALLGIIPQIALTVIMRKTLIAGDETTFPELSLQKLFFIMTELIVSCLFGTIIQAGIIQVVSEIYTQEFSTVKGSLEVMILHRFRTIFRFAVCYSIASCALLVTVGFNLIGRLTADIALNFHVIEALFLGALSIVFVPFAVHIMLSWTIALPILMVEKKPRDVTFITSSGLVLEHGDYFVRSMSLLFAPAFFANWIYRRLVEEMFGTFTLAIILKGLWGVVFLPLRTM